MTGLPAPSSPHELLARARQAARLAHGRAAFVGRARVLPVGVPLAALAAVATVAALRPDRTRGRRRRRAAYRRTAGAALLAAAGALAGAWAEAEIEWALRERAYRRQRGW
jgi:hypothetical protein